MNHGMDRWRLLYAAALLALATAVFAQLPTSLEPFGLEGMRVNDLRLHGSYLFAAADTDGVFMRYLSFPDSNWRSLGLRGKKVNAVFPHLVGLGLTLTITVGVTPDINSGDTTRLYCSPDFAITWNPSDTGIAISELRDVVTIDGIPDPRVCGETFIGGSGRVYRHASGGWEKVFDVGTGAVNIVAVDHNNAIWVGGQNDSSLPYVAHSEDKGMTWETSFPLATENAVYSLAIGQSGVAYAGLQNIMLKSLDNGKTWFYPIVCLIPMLGGKWFAIEANRTRPEHLVAGGAVDRSDAFVMWETTHAGHCWTSLGSDSLKAVSSIVQDPFDDNVFYLGTLGTGVVRYTRTTVGAEGDKSIPQDFFLRQNYPNPFNPVTAIEYALPIASEVRLAIYDVLGKEVTVLAEGWKPAGVYHVQWAGRDRYGRKLPSGVYLYRLEANHVKLMRKVMIMR